MVMTKEGLFVYLEDHVKFVWIDNASNVVIHEQDKDTL